MNFCEKIQKIRTDNKMSQEQMAEKLGVPIHLIYKWESGRRYPNLEQINKICQTFNCSKEKLENNEIKLNDKTKSTLSNYVESTLNYLSKTTTVFNNLTFAQGFKNIINILFIFMILGLILVFLNQTIDITLYNLNIYLPDNIYNSILFFSKGIYLLLIFILSIIVIIQIIKDKNLRRIEKELDPMNENIPNKKNINNNEPNKSLLKVISSKIIIFILKVISFFSIIPLLFILFIAIFLAVISIILMFEGIIFIGLVFASIALIISVIQKLLIIYNIIFSKPNNIKYILIILFSLWIIIGSGIWLTIVQISEFRIVEKSSTQKTITENILMQDNLLLNTNYEEVTFIIDNNINNQVHIAAIFDEGIYGVNITTSEDVVNIINEPIINLNKWYETIIKDIKNKQINKNKFLNKVIIKTTDENIKTILRNISATYQIEVTNIDNDYLVKYITPISDKAECVLNDNGLYICVEHQVSNAFECNCIYNNEIKDFDCQQTPNCSCIDGNCTLNIEKTD